MRTIYRDIVGGFIFSSDGKLLLGKNRKGGVYEGSYVVPGGGIDEGETKLQALHREMLEETGIDINTASISAINIGQGEHEKILSETSERVLVKMDFYDYRIDLPTTSSETEIRADDDWAEPTWFELDALNELNLGPAVRKTLLATGILKN